MVCKGSYTKGELMVPKCSHMQGMRLQVARVKASDTSSKELQHHYTIFCLYASRVKQLYRISDSSAQQQPSKLRKDTKWECCNRGARRRQGIALFSGPLKLWLRAAADKGEYGERTPPSCERDWLTPPALFVQRKVNNTRKIFRK